jgi:hypothetical protein
MLRPRYDAHSGWFPQTVPFPAGAKAAMLTRVSCPTKPTLAEAWNGTSWSIQDTPNPAATSNALDGVSCVTADSCVAVGSAPDPGGYSATLVEATG